MTIKNQTIQLIQCPKTKEDLSFINDRKKYLENCSKMVKYYFYKGIPIFLPEKENRGNNLKFSRFYNIYSNFYDFIFKTAFFFKKEYGIEYQNIIKRMGDFVDIKSGNRVLEISIGTGNIMALFPILNDVELYGLDISIGMLSKCAKKMKKLNKSIELFQGEAENLPFKDTIFDVVYSVGGINFYNDKQKAIQEMIRVAKPGARFIISDETEKLVDNSDK